MAPRKKEVIDLTLSSEQAQTLRDYIPLVYKIAYSFRNSITDPLFGVEDLAQLALIKIAENMKHHNLRSNCYKRCAIWACMEVRRHLMGKRQMPRPINIDYISEEYNARLGHTPEYDRYELLGCAEEFVSNLPNGKDKMLLEYLFGLNGAPYLRDTEIVKELKMSWGGYDKRRKKLLIQLRNAPRVKEILKCWT